MQQEHVAVTARKNSSQNARDQGVNLIRQPAIPVVRGGGGLYDRVGSDHFARNQVAADAEMLQRALGLRSP
jgi:hypothetical protein